MNMRETINRNPRIAGGVVAGLVLIALIVLLTTGGSSDAPAASGDVWFTDDDGATWFQGDLRSNTPPFMHDGKEAVLAFVYSCPDGKKFTGLMERYQPAAKQVIEKSRTGIKNLTPAEREELAVIEMRREWKRPGEKEWKRAGSDLPDIKCPDGSPATYVVAR